RGLFPPARSISLASSLNRSMRRAAIATCTPSAASPLAMARPMPWLAPVTRAVFPARCRSTMLALSAGQETTKRVLRERPCERQANNHFDEIAPPHGAFSERQTSLSGDIIPVEALYIATRPKAGQCQLWVRLGHSAMSDQCPLCPRQQTLPGVIRMSA